MFRVCLKFSIEKVKLGGKRDSNTVKPNYNEPG